jgi:hypothetical protein
VIPVAVGHEPSGGGDVGRNVLLLAAGAEQEEGGGDACRRANGETDKWHDEWLDARH